MSERKIEIVPQNAKFTKIGKMVQVRRVVAYARVSTNTSEQENSLEAQRDFFTKFINKHSDWVFCGVYIDEGITGTNRNRREGFNRMVQDAEDGKFDLIITKSFSRFARNTVDNLIVIRQLKAINVEVYFQKEEVYTFDTKGEFLITLWGGFAQQESESISENIRWGIRRAYENGKYSKRTANFLGYARGTEKGAVVVDEREAKIVKYIYYLFLEGFTDYKIAPWLSSMGIPTPMGNAVWQDTTISNILQNERYKGDALLQKTYVIDPISKKSRKNKGELPQFYVEDGHPAIIPREIFDYVQLIRKERIERFGKSYSSKLEGYSIITCGYCQFQYGVRISHSNDKYKKVFWRCNGCYKKECPNPKIPDEELLQFRNIAIEQFIYENPKRLEIILDEFREICSPDVYERLLKMVNGRQQLNLSSVNTISLLKEIKVLENALEFIFQDGKIIQTDAERKKGSNRLYVKRCKQ